MAVSPVQLPHAPPRGKDRVCFLISSFTPIVGGAERATEALGRTLAQQGEEVLVLTRRFRGLPARGASDGIRIERKGLPLRGKIGSLTYGLHVLLSLATRHRAYRVVHVQNPDTPLLAGFLARILLGRRLFVTVHSDPLVVLNGRGWSGSVRLGLMRSLAEGIGALTDAMRRQLLELGMPPARLHLLPNGIDTSTYRVPGDAERSGARARLGLDSGTTAYVFVGRLVGVKRVDLLLDAWSTLDPAGQRTLMVVGDGPERASLQDRCDRLGLRNVRFEGHQPDPAAYLRAADVFVLPSDREGQSVALVEAMATGLTVVVSDVSGNLAMVDEGFTGLVFPTGEAPALAAALERAGDSKLRARLGAAAAQVGASNSLARTAERHLALYGHDRTMEARG